MKIIDGVAPIMIIVNMVHPHDGTYIQDVNSTCFNLAWGVEDDLPS